MNHRDTVPVAKKRIFGHCAICGERRTLTRDHVPPRGSVRNRRLIVRSLLGHLRGTSDEDRHSQGGVYFDTICAECNENRLGRQYDPELKRLAKSMRSALSAAGDLGISLPNPVRLSCKPQRVARAVVGHLLAAVPRPEVGQPPRQAPVADGLRRYFLRPSDPLPAQFRIYCWPYTGKRIVVARTVVKIHDGQPYVSEILKFSPVGFWIVHQPPDGLAFPATDLLPDRTIGLDEEALVPFEMLNRIDPTLPEAPGDSGATFLGGDVGLVAEPKSRTRAARKRKKRRR